MDYCKIEAGQFAKAEINELNFLNDAHNVLFNKSGETDIKKVIAKIEKKVKKVFQNLYDITMRFLIADDEYESLLNGDEFYLKNFFENYFLFTTFYNISLLDEDFSYYDFCNSSILLNEIFGRGREIFDSSLEVSFRRLSADFAGKADSEGPASFTADAERIKDNADRRAFFSIAEDYFSKAVKIYKLLDEDDLVHDAYEYYCRRRDDIIKVLFIGEEVIADTANYRDLVISSDATFLDLFKEITKFYDLDYTDCYFLFCNFNFDESGKSFNLQYSDIVHCQSKGDSVYLKKVEEFSIFTYTHLAVFEKKTCTYNLMEIEFIEKIHTDGVNDKKLLSVEGKGMGTKALKMHNKLEREAKKKKGNATSREVGDADASLRAGTLLPYTDPESENFALAYVLDCIKSDNTGKEYVFFTSFKKDEKGRYIIRTGICIEGKAEENKGAIAPIFSTIDVETVNKMIKPEWSDEEYMDGLKSDFTEKKRSFILRKSRLKGN